jgi:Gas vesicle synthesis protein GvpL/GvpF
MVLNAAYLVEESGVTTFVDAVQTWQSPRIQHELTGPWVP